MKLFRTQSRTVAYTWIVFIFFTVGIYLYFKGAYDGANRYKRSINMNLALKSAYHFGYIDAKNGRPEDWDGTEEQ
jgi:hypothetical protein